MRYQNVNLRPKIPALGRVSSDDPKRDSSCETRFQREHIFKNFTAHEGVSEVSEQAHDWSKRASEASVAKWSAAE